VIKDIIDTDDMPTGWGFAPYAENRPAKNARCVELFIQAGAIPVGKSVSTELAYFHPGKTANPHNTAHTPGGSSSGTAAAVADFMVPIGFGSQTAASVIRPASYCGIVGYKPTKGAFDLQGVMELAPSLDAIGLMARSVEDISLGRSVLCGSLAELSDAFADNPPRVCFMRGPHWLEGTEPMRENLQRAAQVLVGNGAEMKQVPHPPALADLTECQKTVMAFEIAQLRAHEYETYKQELGEPFRALVETGRAISQDEYDNAQEMAQRGLRVMDQLFEEIDIILTPAAPGEAPEGLHATGDPLFSRAWTLLQLPCISIPFGKGPKGLPLSVQLVGRHDADDKFLAAAQWIKRCLDAS
jgi:amidase